MPQAATGQQGAKRSDRASLGPRRRVWVIAACVLAAFGPASGQVVRTSRGPRTGMGVIKKDPKLALEAMRLRCERYLDAAEDLLTDDKPVRAWQSLKLAKGILTDKAQAKRWLGLAVRVNTAGQAVVKDANEAYERGDYAAALSGYRRAASGYAGLPVGTNARGKLRELKNDPSVRAARLEAQAAKMLALVEGTIARQRKRLAARAAAAGKTATSRPTTRPAPPVSDLEVLKTLDDEAFMDEVDRLELIVKTCRPAPTALKAAAWLDKLKADSAGKARIARLRLARKARQDLAAADAYRKAGMRARSAALYRKIAKAYPGTPAGLEAGKRLAAVETRLKNR